MPLDFLAGVVENGKRWHQLISHKIHGTNWHIYLHEWLIFMVHLSKYTIHGSKKGMEKIPCCIKSHYNMYMSLMYMYSLTRSLPDLFTINSLVFPLAAQPIFKLHLRVEVQSSPFFCCQVVFGPLMLGRPVSSTKNDHTLRVMKKVESY